jgi:hypothetical protein
MEFSRPEIGVLGLTPIVMQKSSFSYWKEKAKFGSTVKCTMLAPEIV